MLLNFQNLIEKYKLNIDGILHIGAHYGQEIELYKKHEIKNILCFEPTPETFFLLNEIAGNNAECFNIGLGNENKTVNMHIESANRGQSNSILKPILHLQQYPYIQFHKTIEIPIMKLDDFMIFYKSINKNKQKKFNFINIDVQGYELEVFKGAKETLKSIDYIISEVNKEELYENCTKINEIDNFLNEFNFERMETNFEGITWGDAFYIKRNKNE